MNRLLDAVSQALAPESQATELAYAKINLALHVTGRRPDGYHNLQTFAVFADFGDILTARPAKGGFSLAIDGVFANHFRGMDAEDNLVTRAVRAAERASGIRIGAEIGLTKRLPAEAGLGGGSSDAAAALRLINRVAGLKLSPEKLMSIAAQLGADVPMCLHALPVVAKGIGETLRPVAGVPPLPVVLAFPGGGVPTSSVFAAVEKPDNDGLPDMPERFASPLEVVFWLRKTRNDLARPAARISALAGDAAKRLHRDPDSLFARMTGSGTSAFAIYISLAAAERAADQIRREHPDWWVIAAMTGESP